MKIRDLIKQLEDMLLIYGDRTILTITDIESEYSIKEIEGKMCAKYFEPSDHVAEVTVRIKRNSSIKTLPSVTPKPFHNIEMREVLAYIDGMPEDVWQEFTDCLEYRGWSLERKTAKWCGSDFA